MLMVDRKCLELLVHRPESPMMAKLLGKARRSIDLHQCRRRLIQIKSGLIV
ncbi:hypothetical protein [Bradyrhizobium sp. USDA 3315]